MSRRLIDWFTDRQLDRFLKLVVYDLLLELPYRTGDDSVYQQISQEKDRWPIVLNTLTTTHGTAYQREKTLTYPEP